MNELFLNSAWDFKLDPKRRVSLPAAYRERLKAMTETGSEAIVLSITPQRCLTGLPAERWPEVMRKSTSLLRQGRNGANFQRLFLAMAHITEPDTHGRILIPPRHTKFAGLGKAVHFIGMGSRFEIWDRDTFEEFESQIDMDAVAPSYNDFVLDL